MNVVWTETATAQLGAIRNYLAWSSPGYGQAIAGRIVARTESLADQPYIGGEVPEYGDAAIREVFEHPYRILYFVSDADLQILAVIHSSRSMLRTPPI